MTTTERALEVAALMAEQPAAPAGGPITLGAIEAAYVTMVEGEYRASVLNAQQLRAARFAVVMKAHGIGEGASVTIVPGEDGAPMQLLVAPPAPTLGNGTGRPMGVA